MMKFKLFLFKFLGKFIKYFKRKYMLELIEKITEIIKSNLYQNGYNISTTLEINENNIAYTIKLIIPLNIPHYILNANIINNNGTPNILYKIYIDNNINLGYFDEVHYNNLDNERRKVTEIINSLIMNNKLLFLGI